MGTKTEYRVYYSYGCKTYKRLSDAEFALSIAKVKWPDARIEVVTPSSKLGGSDWAFC